MSDRLILFGAHQQSATIVVDADTQTLWDGRVKNLIYNTTTMEWEAQTSSGSGGGGGGSVTMSASDSSVETRSLPMKVAIDEVSSSVTYVGESLTGTATSSALWRMKRITQSGTVLIIEWADGDGLFDNTWDDRETLSYS